MANSVFDKAREGFATGAVVWTSTPTHKMSLVRGYTYNASHTYVSDVTGAGGALHATVTLSGKDATNGACDATVDPTFTTPAANANDHSILIYQASAVTGGADVAATAQRLIAWIDTANGLPIQPNGADITISFDNGDNKIFRL